jgi:hypothetical protein
MSPPGCLTPGGEVLPVHHLIDERFTSSEELKSENVQVRESQSEYTIYRTHNHVACEV